MPDKEFQTPKVVKGREARKRGWHKVTVDVPPEALEALDARRGTTSRTDYLWHQLAPHFDHAA